MAAVAAFIGIFAARILLDNIEEITLRERETIAHCVRNFRVPRGPRLDLDSCLRDVADANRMLADLAREEGWRFRHRCSLVYRPGAGQETFFRALRVGPRLAALVGSVVVDVEEVDVRGDPEPRIDDDEASSSPAADDEGFEHVAACRRATLAEFYTMIQPALRQIAVDRVPMRASLSAPPVAPPVQSTTSLEDDEDLCAVCFDGALEVVTRCGHSYCEECYLRWLSISRECPLCRERLGAELRGGNNGSYALVGAGNLSRDGNGDGDGDGEGVDAEWLRGRLEALPAVEDPGARRARVAYLMAKLREKGEGARDADTDASGHPPP